MDGKIIIGIDGTNIRGGGGVTHLVELIKALDPNELGIREVILWTSAPAELSLSDEPWLTVLVPKLFEKGFLGRLLWQIFFLSKSARKMSCDVLYVPGGFFFCSFRPVVTMSQNLLPFDRFEFARFGFSKTTLRYLLLRFVQSRSFKRADGVIFLTEFARDVIEQTTGKLKNTSLIPHGINEKFFKEPSPEKLMKLGHHNQPIKVLYVSIVNHYKHQWNVVRGMALLRERYGYSIQLTLVGPNFPDPYGRLLSQIDQSDPNREWVDLIGAVSNNDLVKYYDEADIGVFASSCENLPIILLEKMASGLPIACSDRGPMPSVLGDAGVYFDPENADDIGLAVSKLIESPHLRMRSASDAYRLAERYSWIRCANDTFGFIKTVALKFRNTKTNVGKY